MKPPPPPPKKNQKARINSQYKEVAKESGLALGKEAEQY